MAPLNDAVPLLVSALPMHTYSALGIADALHVGSSRFYAPAEPYLTAPLLNP